MTGPNVVSLNAPYLLLIGDVDQPSFAKTAFGLIEWRRDIVAGQLRFPGNRLDLGVPDLSVDKAVRAGVRSLVIGVSPVGGRADGNWHETLLAAAGAGLDIVSGMHMPLGALPGLAEMARKSGSRLVDVRVPPANLPIGTGKKRPGRRILTVGTDCAVGKKYTALALAQALNNRNMNAIFRATGQTGIMIAGEGLPIDAVVSDFVSGAAEMLSPANDPDHWDVIEGQGSLFHPSFAAVSLGLLHGSQPDEIVICHDATREVIETSPHAPVPGVGDVMELNLRCGRVTNGNIACLGVSVNTSGIAQAERQRLKARISEETSLPCVDPIVDGCDAFVDALLKKYGRAENA